MTKILLIILAALILITSCTKVTRIEKNETKDMSFYVTKENWTEPAFNNEYWDEHRPGIYTDINTGEPLFSSLDKFDSGTGWPSFTRTINEALIQTKEDSAFGSVLQLFRVQAPNGGSRSQVTIMRPTFLGPKTIDGNWILLQGS